MNEFITIKHDFSSEYIDMAIKRAKKSNEKKSQRNYRQKVSFEKKAQWRKCFSGREEYAQ